MIRSYILLGLLLFKSALAQVPVFVSQNLGSNRFNNVTPDSLQVTVYNPVESQGISISFECLYGTDPTPVKTTLVVGSKKITTAEYKMNACVFSNVFHVSGVSNTAGHPGIAIGIFGKDVSSKNFMFRSRSKDASKIRKFVGVEPFPMSYAQFGLLTPHITDSYILDQSRTSLFGAEFILDQ